ncbi:MAG: S1 RNA-binding domain-containing protein, partial [Thermosulfidibacteraceae bacterium]
IEDYGIFVEFAPGKEGLLHISQISDRRIRNIKDEFSIGDEIEAKIMEIDELGRFKLTRRGLEGDPKSELDTSSKGIGRAKSTHTTVKAKGMHTTIKSNRLDKRYDKNEH